MDRTFSSNFFVRLQLNCDLHWDFFIEQEEKLVMSYDRKSAFSDPLAVQRLKENFSAVGIYCRHIYRYPAAQ